MAKRKSPAKKQALPPTTAISSVSAEAQPAKLTSEEQFPIVVGIGASAGGLAAIEQFFAAMHEPKGKSIAFVVIQHLSTDHKSILSELLKRYTQMQVFEAEDDTLIAPNCIYTIPPNRDIAVLNGRLQLFEINPSKGPHFSIDFFFRSLASDRHEQAISIVLSGTGTDGTLGIRSVKGEGGMVMAQLPSSTEFDGMPRSAIATGLVDYILTPAEMPAQLLSYLDRASSKVNRIAAIGGEQSAPSILPKIFILLRSRTGHDFSHYKQNTLVRRIERRMALHRIDRAADYLRFLQESSEEVSALFRDLLIGVTSFFRDPEAFAALEIGIPAVFSAAPKNSTVRIWVCGCSTGEEAYSIAILVYEYLEKVNFSHKVQIFATDIDRRATDQARTGVFPASIAADVSADRLERFFTLDTNGSYRIEKPIRDLLIFAQHDLLKDPPFSKLSLITCRNLLIYLNVIAQSRLIELFHYSLIPGGLLFLGNSEATGERPHLFEPVDRKAKLFRRRAEDAVAPVALLQEPAPILPVPPDPLPVATGRRSPSLKEIAEACLLQHPARSAVVVDPLGEILYFHGRTGKYLEPPPGATVTNILAMAREGLQRDLTAALHRSVSRKETVYLDSILVKTNGHYICVNVTVLPMGLLPPFDNWFLVIFDEKPEVVPAEAIALDTPSQSPAELRVIAMEHRLRSKDDYIQTIIEEMETSTEELKSSNEEMQSVNEEMQSTNEELETSREELQSINEELATVNQELRQKVTELARANNDMNNLLAGTGVATLFVDHDMRIARFTPSMSQIINLIDSDVGRPLSDIVSNLIGRQSLVAEVRSVLDTLIPVESEVQTNKGRSYILAIRPYRTLENVIEGAVVSFVDVTSRKLDQQKQLEFERFRHAAQIETVGIAYFKLNGLITSANEAFLHMVDYTRDDLIAGLLDWDRLTPPEWLPHSRKAFKELARAGRATPYEMQYLRKDGSRGKALFAKWKLGEDEAIAYAISVGPETP